MRIWSSADSARRQIEAERIPKKRFSPFTTRRRKNAKVTDSLQKGPLKTHPEVLQAFNKEQQLRFKRRIQRAGMNERVMAIVLVPSIIFVIAAGIYISHLDPGEFRIDKNIFSILAILNIPLYLVIARYVLFLSWEDLRENTIGDNPRYFVSHLFKNSWALIKRIPTTDGIFLCLNYHVFLFFCLLAVWVQYLVIWAIFSDLIMKT